MGGNARWVLLILLLIIVGGGLQIYAQSIEPEFVDKTIISDGNQRNITQLIYPTEKHVATFLQTLAYAAAITVFLTVFVTGRIEKERNQKDENDMKELQTRIRTDVLEGVLQKFIPEKIFDTLRSDVIETNIIRRDARWNFDFEVKDGGIGLTQTMTYTLENTGPQTEYEEYTVTVQTGRPGNQYLKEVKYKDRSQQEFTNPDKVETETWDDGTEIHIYEIQIPQNSSVNITVTFRADYPVHEVTDAYFTRYPLVNAELIVNHPPDYHFTLFPASSVPFTSVTDRPGKKIYNAEGGLLPFQGIVFTIARAEDQKMGSQQVLEHAATGVSTS